jgi:hypothetical protein
VSQLESEGYVLEYSTKMGWLAHGPDRYTLVFKQDNGLCKGMPYIDLSADPEALNIKTSAMKDNTGVALIQTVQGNFVGYTREAVQRAIAVRDVQAMMAHPSDKTLKHLVSSTSAVKNVDISVSEISNTR